jgi:hypothetical protein
VGRKRRVYRLTDEGRAALQAWLAEPTDEPTEIRDLSTLKLFFGAQAEPDQVRDLAMHAAEAHRKRLAEYEAIAAFSGIETHERATLEMGLNFERFAISYWEDVARGL